MANQLRNITDAVVGLGQSVLDMNATNGCVVDWIFVLRMIWTSWCSVVCIFLFQCMCLFYVCVLYEPGAHLRAYVAVKHQHKIKRCKILQWSQYKSTWTDSWFIGVLWVLVMTRKYAKSYLHVCICSNRLSLSPSPFAAMANLFSTLASFCPGSAPVRCHRETGTPFWGSAEVHIFQTVLLFFVFVACSVCLAGFVSIGPACPLCAPSQT